MSDAGLIRELGYWWLPSNESRKIPGTLSYSVTGDTRILECTGTLRSDQLIPSQDVIPVIHGFLPDGTPVSLMKCTVSRRQISQLTCDTYRCAAILRGSHVAGIEHEVFQSGRVQFTLLQEWISTTPFKFKLEFPNDAQRDQFKYELAYQSQTFVIFNVQSISSTLEVDSVTSIPGVPLGDQIKLKNTYYLKLIPDRQRSLAWYLEQFQILRSCVALLVGEPVYFIAVDLIQLVDQSDREPLSVTANLYSRFYGYTKSREKFDSGAVFRMLVPYPVIEREYPDIFDRWFADYGRLATPYSTFFGVLFLDTLTLEHRFLTLMQALESFHRHTMQNEYMSPEEYKEQVETPLVAAIPSRLDGERPIPNGLREALMARLKYGNEYSLRRRIHDLFSIIGSDLTNVVTDDVNNFIASIVDRRNRLTHRTKESPRPSEAETVELFKLCEQLEIFMTALFMQRVGVDPDVYSVKVRERAGHLKSLRLI